MSKNKKIFISGTNTDIGKTLISTWLCLHFGLDYFKPIQSGNIEFTDSRFIADISADIKIHPECYNLAAYKSPHLAAKEENIKISIDDILLPESESILIEGAGGLLVPINDNQFIIDMIKKFSVPVILVASSELGTINHTCLSIEALITRNIEVLGVIMNGPENKENKESIEKYSGVKVLQEFPILKNINKESLLKIKPTTYLRSLIK